MREKSTLLKQLTELERELDSKNEQLSMLSKRYKVLEMSLQSMNSDNKRINPSTKMDWAKTLPAKFDNQAKLLNYLSQLNNDPNMDINQLNLNEMKKQDGDLSINTNMNLNIKSKSGARGVVHGRGGARGAPHGAHGVHGRGIGMGGDNGYDEKENDGLKGGSGGIGNSSKGSGKAGGNMNLLAREDSQLDAQLGSLASIDSWMNLRYHFDSVRCMCYDDSRSSSLLVCGSDDGVISLWNVERIVSNGMNALNQHSNRKDNSNNNKQDVFDPWMSYHGHDGSVICNCIVNGSTFSTFNDKTLFATGGIDGSIMIWQSPGVDDNNRSDLNNLGQYRVGKIKETRDVIWDLECHASSPIIAGVSADKRLRLFDVCCFVFVSCILYFFTFFYFVVTVFWFLIKSGVG